MALPARPIVALAAAGVAGTTGVIAGTAGALQIARANAQKQRQENRRADRNTEHLTEVERLNAATQALGNTQERAIHDVITRMEEFLVQNGKQVLESERLVHDGVTDSDTTDTTGMTKLNPQIAAWAAGIVGSAAVGGTTLTALREGMTRFGTASTGRPILQLYGAARQSALRAAFAGGSIETGGLGEAFGGKIPYVVAAGVAVLTGGASVKVAGSLAQADAEKDRQATDDAILELDQYDQRSRWVRLRAYELDDILNELIPPAVDALDLLESEPFDMEVHGPRLQAALILASGVAQIVDAPLIDADCNLDPHTEQIAFKYRNARKENRMPDKDTVLSGTTLPPKADGGFNAQAAYEAFNLFIRTVRDAVQTHQTESTKREQLRTQRETQIEQIRATERILRDYFDRVYAERRENHQLLFAGLDQALKTGDNATLQTVVGGIVDLARTSPLADLGNLGELRRAMEDPNTVFKL